MPLTADKSGIIYLMINHHQPTIFGDAVIVALSSRADGNMKFGIDDDVQTARNRQVFLESIGIDSHHTTLVGITYTTDDFTKYRTVGKEDQGAGILQISDAEPVDALATDQRGHALFLPLADCIGAVLYDPEHHTLMISHLGRHSVEAQGTKKSIAYLSEHFDTNPARLQVWLSPGVGKASYPLHNLGGKSLREAITEELLQSGVVEANIEGEDIDTAQSDDYFSHSEFLKGNKTEAGRFAIVAMMAGQGEPAS